MVNNNNNNNNNNNKPIVGFLFALHNLKKYGNRKKKKRGQVGIRFKDVSKYTHFIL